MMDSLNRVRVHAKLPKQNRSLPLVRTEMSASKKEPPDGDVVAPLLGRP
jgi:hypothetical protein